jgi:hypothetical protein
MAIFCLAIQYVQITLVHCTLIVWAEMAGGRRWSTANNSSRNINNNNHDEARGTVSQTRDKNP